MLAHKGCVREARDVFAQVRGGEERGGEGKEREGEGKRGEGREGEGRGGEGEGRGGEGEGRGGEGEGRGGEERRGKGRGGEKGRANWAVGNCVSLLASSQSHTSPLLLPRSEKGKEDWDEGGLCYTSSPSFAITKVCRW